MATTDSTSNETSADRAKDTGTAVNLMAQGKRNMICGEIPVAVNQFQDACQLLSKHYGEMAKECAEAYYCYGQSLLDLARMETGVLGNALQGVDVDDEDTADEKEEKGNEQFENANKLPGEERDKLRDEVYDAMAGDEKNTAKERGEKDAKVEKTAESKDLNKDETDSKESREKDVMNETADEKKNGENADTKDNVEMMDVKESNCGEDKTKEMDVEEIGDLDKKNDGKSTKQGEGDNSRKTVADKDSIKTEEKEQKKIISEEGDKIKDVKLCDKTKTEASCKENIEDKETLNDKKPEDDKKDDVDEEEIMEDEEDKEDEGDAAENEGEDGEGKTDEEDPEDVSNLQLAWEMLELAKMIYLKDSAKEAQLRAAQSYLKLGEVSLETERYEQAISDFKDCLQIQEKHLSPEDRLIAESHYQLGLAYGFNQQYDESIDHYRAAIKVIENKIVTDQALN
ncbi:histone-binding protein N1/N2 isoform X2 [Patella vulgata]|uniref:histone-binding protein N1/N2 isoform X2 n=1 Tax=Patella vulgata TaxID=6465 RepID=UPI0021804BB8|nr:histone-binding protein N1/N2 isoform X2 [Patella vulgata]